MQRGVITKYRPLRPVTLPDRTWPDQTITRAPIWCSVDLRDGNQALAVPMNVEEKLEYFAMLVKLGFKEIEVGFPSASEIEFRFIRRLIEENRIPDGVAIQVLRECLVGLAALHREGIVHGDVKPSNVTLKRTGNAKIIDIGSAIDRKSPSARRMWSPAYAAPEVLEGGDNTPRSDLASLGYVLVEMLAGRTPFEGLTTLR